MNITMVNSVLKTNGIDYKNCFEIVQSFSINHVVIKIDGKDRYDIKIRSNGTTNITKL